MDEPEVMSDHSDEMLPEFGTFLPMHSIPVVESNEIPVIEQFDPHPAIVCLLYTSDAADE